MPNFFDVAGKDVEKYTSHSALSEDAFLEGCRLLRRVALNEIDAVRKAVLANKALLKFEDYDRRTALHVSASEGHLKLTTLLLELGANPNRSDRWGGSPLDDAQRHRFPEVASLLRAHGARLGFVDGSTDHGMALISASAKGEIETVDELLAGGTNPNSIDYDSRSAMHLACAEGHTAVVTALLQSRADPDCKDRWGCTPLTEAQGKKHADVVQLLIKAGAVDYGVEPPNSTRVPMESPSFDPQVTDPNMVDWADIKTLEKIGSGAFGEIYKCRWRGTLVAAKTIKSEKSLHGGAAFVAGLADAPSDLRMAALNDFRHEIGFLTQLHHPHICLLLGYSLSEHGRECMLSELMKCSLLDVLRSSAQSGVPFSVQRTLRYATHFALGMNFLHTSKPPVLHRDLKPANLLLDFSDNLKISDFGLAKIRPPAAAGLTDEDTPFVMTGETGSYRFMAPEVFRHEKYGRPVDVYSFAMILFYMLDGAPPWADLDGVAAVRAAALKHERPPIPRHWDLSLQELLRSTWADEPRARPSFAAVLEILENVYKSVFKMSYEEAMRRGDKEPDGCNCTLM
jgi:hypothetical protein